MLDARCWILDLHIAMMRHFNAAILASVILHIIAFIVFTGVKLYYMKPDIQDKMPVAFVRVREEKPMRRSNPIRQMSPISKLPQNLSQKQAIIRPAYESSEVFYTDAPEKVFSVVGNVEQKGAAAQLMFRPPSFKRLQPFISPTGAAVIKETYPSEAQPNLRIISGENFLKEVPTIQAGPSMRDILQRFAQDVRRRIESRKIYPLAARRSVLEGQVRLKITIMKSGQLETVEIMESSGHEILDKAALGSVRKAAPFPSLPQAVERERIQMDIYLVFRMT